MNTGTPESHPLQPFLPPQAKLLMMGSFPPQEKRWTMNFYYPNPANDMWRIMGILFFDDKNHFWDQTQKTFIPQPIIQLLTQKGIALFDTATIIQRLQNNASDRFLQILQPTDTRELLRQLPHCTTIAATGGKAFDTLRLQLNASTPQPIDRHSQFIFEERPIKLYRMPSTSRAYPLAMEKKVQAYRAMFQEIGLL